MSENTKKELTLEEKKERVSKSILENYRRKQERIENNCSYTGKTPEEYLEEARMMLTCNKIEKMTDEEIEKENEQARVLHREYSANFHKSEKLRKEEFLQQNADNPELIEKFLLSLKTLKHVQKSIEMANTMTYEEIYKKYKEYRKFANKREKERRNRVKQEKERGL